MSEHIIKNIRSNIVCLRATINEIQVTIQDIEHQTNMILQSKASYSDTTREQLLQTYLNKLHTLKYDLSSVNTKHKQCTSLDF